MLSLTTTGAAGISVVRIVMQTLETRVRTVISNLNAVKQKIIRYFSQHALEIYGMT